MLEEKGTLIFAKVYLLCLPGCKPKSDYILYLLLFILYYLFILFDYMSNILFSNKIIFVSGRVKLNQVKPSTHFNPNFINGCQFIHPLVFLCFILDMVNAKANN